MLECCRMRKVICPDCGPKPVNHTLQKAFIFFEWLTGPFMRLFEVIGNASRRVFGWQSVDRVANFLTKTFLRIGLLKEVDICTADSLRVRLAAEEASRRGVVMKRVTVFGQPTIMYTARFQNSFLVFEQLPRPEGDYENLKWIDNKAVVRKKISALGMPLARGGKAFTKNRALEIFRAVGAPVIVKPHIGSRSAHTTIHINSEEELERAFYKAKILSPWVVVEKELAGFVHRITFIGGKLFAVIRREQPHIVGDGALTVRELVEKENKNPKRDGSYFYPLRTDEEALKEIAYYGMSWDSVPAPGQTVLLNQKAVGFLGSGLTDLTDVIHPDNVDLFKKIDELVAVPLHGIDFITTDISKPWHQISDCGIIEFNSLPFIEMHHNPLVGEPRDAMAALWDIVFPNSLTIKPN